MGIYNVLKILILKNMALAYKELKVKYVRNHFFKIHKKDAV
jgi:hypothetical protein